MLSDESSSDSETGRFKCRTKTQDEAQATKSRDNSFRSSRDNLKPSGRSRRHENERYHREFDRRRDEREVYDYHAKERHRYSRHSPVRRRRSHERSRHREPYDRRDKRHDRNSREQSKDHRSDRDSREQSKDHRSDRDSRERSKDHRSDRDSREGSKDHRSDSKDKTQKSESKTHTSPIHNKSMKDVIRSHIIEKKPEKNETKRENRSTSVENRKRSSSLDRKMKKSEVHKPVSVEQPTQRSKSPVIVEVNSDGNESEEVKPGSYYNMIPAIVKEKSEESSEIDSSDDEKLRAKLLNLEKEISKTKKKKHKKKHKKKGSKSNKDKKEEPPASVEVSSTTDIQEKVPSNKISGSETAEVTSTQKISQKESSEEGEILSDEEPQSPINFDCNDLRHKLKRSTTQANKLDVCGPALPPHLEKRYEKSLSPDIEGPELPPKLQNKMQHIGPSIPQDMRKVLEEKSKENQEVIRYNSSDEEASVVGPLPEGSEEKWTHAHKQLEERALDMKIKKIEGHTLNNTDVKSREKWMLELPEGKTKYLGLEARSFRAKEGPDMSDRSSWTDTPEEKARKAAGLVKEEDADASLQQEVKIKHIAIRDEEQEKDIRKHKKKHKRDESLLEMHQKKLKKKKKKEEKDEEKPERRPFSRDVDLQVNRFDEAQKKSIIKKAQALDSRFSRGEAKYL